MSEKYFLGAMTQHGFSTEFGKVIGNTDNYTYILKGGAGTGKSSLMKKIADEFEVSEDVTRFYCSSDPYSLDAVILNGSKVVIVDGTSPHTFDPIYPGVCQKIINLGDYWDENALKEHKEEIISVTVKNQSLLARAKRFSIALSNVCEDTYFCGCGCILNDKLNGFLERFNKKILSKKGGGTGRKDIRQLTALTEAGCVTQTETLENYLDVYCMNDNYFACSHAVIEAVANEAIHRGYDVIMCPSHAFNNEIYEHLLIPELGTALVTSSPLTELKPENAKPVNLNRFYDKKALAGLKSRMRLNRITARSLCGEIYETIRNAKIVHDEIEKYYISAMDFDKIDKIREQIAAEIKSNKK